MSRKVVERLRARLYKHRLETTGRLPTGKETRALEEKAVKIAEETDKKRKAKEGV